MKINSINPTQNYNNINFQKASSAVSVPNKEVQDTFTLHGSYEDDVIPGVPKRSRDTINRLLNDCYGLLKENFPDEKISVLFNMRTKKKARDHIAYSIAVGINSSAKEGITRDTSGFTEFLEFHNADFYHAKTIYSNTSEKLNYNKIKTEVLSDFSKAIEDYKNKPASKEEPKFKEKENFFKKLFSKIFKK